MSKEKLICYCVDEQEKPTDVNHVQSKDANDEVVVECTECGRFLKFKAVQKGIPHKDEKKD